MMYIVLVLIQSDVEWHPNVASEISLKYSISGCERLMYYQ
jgi:hypothetical protein